MDKLLQTIGTADTANAELTEKNNQLEVAVGQLLKEVRFLKGIINEKTAARKAPTIGGVISAAAIQGTRAPAPKYPPPS